MDNSEKKEKIKKVFYKVMKDNVKNIPNISPELEFRLSRFLKDEEFQIKSYYNDKKEEVLSLYVLDDTADGVPKIIEYRVTFYDSVPDEEDIDEVEI